MNAKEALKGHKMLKHIGVEVIDTNIKIDGYTIRCDVDISIYQDPAHKETYKAVLEPVDTYLMDWSKGHKIVRDLTEEEKKKFWEEHYEDVVCRYFLISREEEEEDPRDFRDSWGPRREL